LNIYQYSMFKSSQWESVKIIKRNWLIRKNGRKRNGKLSCEANSDIASPLYRTPLPYVVHHPNSLPNFKNILSEKRKHVTENTQTTKIASLLLIPLFVFLLPLLLLFRSSTSTPSLSLSLSLLPSPNQPMDTLIALVNRIQRACTVLGDHGAGAALPTLWEALPSVAVVGGQVRSSRFFHSSPFYQFRSMRYSF